MLGVLRSIAFCIYIHKLPTIAECCGESIGIIAIKWNSRQSVRLCRGARVRLILSAGVVRCIVKLSAVQPGYTGYILLSFQLVKKKKKKRVAKQKQG